MNLVNSGHQESQPPPINQTASSTNQASMKLQQSRTSTSLHMQYELKIEEVRRTRAKTPVHRIGQLENKSCGTDRLYRDIDTAILLAEQYQAVLPSREATPCPRFVAVNARRNGLRRIKCQDSLQDLIKVHPHNAESMTLGSSDVSCGEASPEDSDSSSYSMAENHAGSPRPSACFQRGSFDSRISRRHSSDSETLLGSDSEPSPNTPLLDYFSNSDLDTLKLIQDSGGQSEPPALAMAENDIGMQLTMDLLTNDLATALHQQNPLESGNRVSGLQILLMIEAYESLQQRIGEEQGHVTEDGGEHVSDVLDHWLQALRSIYERSISRAGRRSQEAVPF